MYLCIAFERKHSCFGEVAEWSIAAVLKTVVLRGTRGSNPCLSARLIKLSPVKLRFYGTFFMSTKKQIR